MRTHTYIYTIRDSHVLTGRNRMELFGTKVSQNVFIVRYSSQKVVGWCLTGRGLVVDWCLTGRGLVVDWCLTGD